MNFKLTVFLVVLLAAMAHGLTLHEEIRLAPGYIDLTECQQYCIAGRRSWDIATDYSSWAEWSTCTTKLCICAPEKQVETERFIVNCQRGVSSSCAQSATEQTGALRWVAGYCGWSTTTLPSVSSTSTVS